jgi:hypothetical protein
VLFVDFAMAVVLGRLACMLFCFLLDIFRHDVHKGLLKGLSSSSSTSWHLELCFALWRWRLGVSCKVFLTHLVLTLVYGYDFDSVYLIGKHMANLCCVVAGA